MFQLALFSFHVVSCDIFFFLCHQFQKNRGFSSYHTYFMDNFINIGFSFSFSRVKIWNKKLPILVFDNNFRIEKPPVLIISKIKRINNKLIGFCVLLLVDNKCQLG
jgi:hypothetical protein